MQLPDFLNNTICLGIAATVLAAIAIVLMMSFGNLLHAILWGPI